MSFKKLAAIQYWGEDGITQKCLDAVTRLLQCDSDYVSKVRVLTDGERYCLLITLDQYDLIAIKSGFSYGYVGEGPRKFSHALALFEAHGIEMDEFEVGKDFIQRINKSALTEDDIKSLSSLSPVRPIRIYDYMSMDDYNKVSDGTLWQTARPVIPFAIIEPRILDLAISFWKHPDANLMDGYRRFEAVVRKRTKIAGENPQKLFIKAFLGPNSILSWNGVSDGEKDARANLIISIFGAYRNPRAHKVKNDSRQEKVSEFLLLNHLFILESEAI